MKTFFSPVSEMLLKKCDPKMEALMNEAIKKSPFDFIVSMATGNTKPLMSVEIEIVDPSRKTVINSPERLQDVACHIKGIAKKKKISINWGGDWKYPAPNYFELCSKQG